MGFPGGSDGKAFAYNVGDPGSTPGLGRSSGDGNMYCKFHTNQIPINTCFWKTVESCMTSFLSDNSFI